MRLALAASIVIALAGAARADDDLARAHQLEAKLEYEQALALVDGVIAKGGADPARLGELHLFAGKLAAGLDRIQVAEDHFARALAVAPALALPDGTSPKLVAPFLVAKSRSQPLRVDITVANEGVTIEPHDPLGVIAGVAVRTADGKDYVARSALTVAVPSGPRIVAVAALDASGNRAWVGEPPATGVPPPPPPPPPPPKQHEQEAPLYARPLPYAIATGVALAAGGVAAWRLSVNQRRWNELRDEGGHEYDELYAVETRGRRWGIAANIGFGVAIAAGVTTGIMWITHLRPGPGAGVGAGGRF